MKQTVDVITLACNNISMFDRIDKSYDKDALKTPQYLVDWLDYIYHFDIDLAASIENHCYPSFFTKEINALNQDWSEAGERGFLNPPYSRDKIDPFIDKAIKESYKNFTTVMVIPELNGESRTEKILKMAINVYHFDKRVKFIHPITGKECGNNNRGTICVEFGKKYSLSSAHHIFVKMDEINL